MNEAAIWQVWGPLLTVALIFAIRFRRAERERPLRLWSLWLVPLLVLVLLGLVLATLRPPLLGWAALATGFAAGALLGWHRGKLIAIRRDPSSGMFLQQVPTLAVLILLGIVALRFVIQYQFDATSSNQPASLAAIMAGDFLLGLAAATIIVTRLELWLRVRALERFD